MSTASLRIVVLGLSLSSSWGNGHATTYRSLLRGMWLRGHQVTFLERDEPWYAAHRDLQKPEFCDLSFYESFADLRSRHAELIKAADVLVIGSYVKEARDMIPWALETLRGVSAFYDIDTPITLSQLATDDCAYLAAAQVRAFDLFLSFAGGPVLEELTHLYGARRAAPLYCSVDTDHYADEARPREVDLGYMGTYSPDRQAGLERWLIEPARRLGERRFEVVGSQYPPVDWPANVQRLEHLAPAEHPHFYGRSRFTLNLTRAAMCQRGYSPSVRLFEAAACATPIISDEWPGLNEFFLEGSEILVARDSGDVERYLCDVDPAGARRIGLAGQARVRALHSGYHRAQELESLLTCAEAAKLSAVQGLNARPLPAHRSPLIDQAS